MPKALWVLNKFRNLNCTVQCWWHYLKGLEVIRGHESHHKLTGRITILDNFGHFFDNLGQFWKILIFFDNFWQLWTTLEFFLTILDNFGIFLTIFDNFGQLWKFFDNFGKPVFTRSPPPQAWSWLGHRWSSSCPFLSSPCEPANDSSPSTDPLLQPPAQIRSQKLKQKNYQKCSTYQTFPTLRWMFDYYESVFHFHPVGEY